MVTAEVVTTEIHCHNVEREVTYSRDLPEEYFRLFTCWGEWKSTKNAAKLHKL